jgi:hypothetical protein
MQENNSLLEKEIERRVKKEALCTDYVVVLETFEVSGNPFWIDNPNNDFLFLISKTIDIPVYSLLCMASVDNFYALTKKTYENQNYSFLQSFRGKVKIQVRNIAPFVPFTIDFLRITPIQP